jgi:hypothetical protein
LYVTAVGNPYPLRITGDGPTKAGGLINACNDGKAITCEDNDGWLGA